MIMKTIKYLAALLCSAFVMGACTETDGLSDQNAGKEKPVVGIEQKLATDLSLEFVLTVGDDAAQVAYAVMTGHENTVPAAVSILANEVSGAQAGETFWVEESDNDEGTFTQTVELDCSTFKSPSDKYQVFAVAITAEGLVSEVETLDVTMNDNTPPAPVDFTPSANTVEVTWAENVVLGTGKATVTIIAWGVGRYYMQDVEIAAENLSVDGNVLTIVCPEAGDGAGYIVSLAKGVVKDLSGNSSPAIASSLTNDGYQNIGWDTPNVEIPITAASFQTPAEDVNWAAEDANLVFTLPVEVMPNSEVKDPIAVVYNEAEGINILYAEWTLGEDYKTVTVYLPKMPTAQFDVIVKEGAFFDVWGNLTSAFEPDDFRYSNYLISVKSGNYLVEYLSAGSDGNPVVGQFPVQIIALDGTSVLLAADWFNYAYMATGGKTGYTCEPYLYGTIDYANQQLVFDGTQIDPQTGALGERSAFASGFYFYDQEKTMMLVFWGSGASGKEPITMALDSDGYATSMSYCDFSIHDYASGGYLRVYACTNVSETADAPVVYVPETTKRPSKFATSKSLEGIKCDTVFTK